MKRIPYGRQSITQEDIDTVVECLQSDFLTTGPLVGKFERNFAEYVDAKYAVAVSNGTAALHLCAMALGVNESSNVITSPITFSASANCVRYCGGRVHFADIHADTVTPNIEAVRKLLAAHPKNYFSGIIPVDLAGYPVNLEEFRQLADEHNLWIIEDACHAPGGWFKDSSGLKQHCGNGKYADLAIFSFHPVKHIACGEGGMVTTNNEELYKRIKRLRSHGMVYQGEPELIENHGKWYMELQELGYNYRIPDILCALGISQLSKAEEGLKRRREIARKYDEAFESKIRTYSGSKDVAGHAYHLYIIQSDNRKMLYDKLREVGIYAQIHYIPLHTMPYYKAQDVEYQNLSVSENYYEKCLSLPMYPTLTNEEQDYVIEMILKHTDG